MSDPLVYRNNRLFCIDQQQLPPKARGSDTIMALYAAIYLEFRGADKNHKYKNLTYEQRLNKLNEFAWNWLEERRLI